MQSKNRVVIAAAGSGKTTMIINESLNINNKKVLIVTYTNKNKDEIIKKFLLEVGYVPKHIMIKTWYSFILSECIRPYQNFVYPEKRIEGTFFRKEPVNRYILKSNIKDYYLNNKNQIDKDRLSDFALECEKKSKGKVIKRLEENFDYIYIDEVQDLAGYDLELFKLFFKSKMNVLLVGDVRQATYTTSNTIKNKKYKGANIINFFTDEQKKGNCIIESITTSFRCNQIICDFADNLYQRLQQTVSKNFEKTGHDGVFYITKNNIKRYIEIFNPQILRYDVRTKVENAINFGISKGLTFERVLIFPTNPIKSYLTTGDIEHIKNIGTKAKLYVAITRAKYSVTFVMDKPINNLNIPAFTFNEEELEVFTLN
ncbi:DNA helicase II [Bacillus sp. AFS077874]|uniref:UvrD-helicase domain-containing protein n=1 Tax=Bacillus sp. AFS077874 TaxID=2033513 RepID=UPI000BF4D204|nr:UvrD-helicase domain-containing protein [Bacillus sp. AFS077874]PFM75249.1 DNA helicase II [Bacillus sp. AFS077874]